VHVKAEHVIPMQNLGGWLNAHSISTSISTQIGEPIYLMITVKFEQVLSILKITKSTWFYTKYSLEIFFSKRQ